VTILLSAHDLQAALELRDLSDPADGPHAMQLLLEHALTALTDAWRCVLDVQRAGRW
jgi:phenylalanyl-tRNA synthetase alpha chain